MSHVLCIGVELGIFFLKILLKPLQRLFLDNYYYYYYEEFISWCHKQPRGPITCDTPQVYSRYVYSFVISILALLAAYFSTLSSTRNWESTTYEPGACCSLSITWFSLFSPVSPEFPVFFLFSRNWSPWSLVLKKLWKNQGFNSWDLKLGTKILFIVVFNMRRKLSF